MTKRTQSIFIAVPLLLAAGYLAVAWHVMQISIDRPIMAITTNSDPWFPRGLAKAYLFASNYDPDASTESGMPAFNFIVAGYNLENSNKDEVMLLSQKFIDKGADIDKPWRGFTPLQAAVLGNEPALVQHLLHNGADPKKRVNHPDRSFDNMTTLEFAEYLASLEKQDMAKVLTLLKK